MAIGVRTQDLRKSLYASPPLAARWFYWARRCERREGVKAQIQPRRPFARNPSRRDLRLLGPNGAGKSTTIGVLILGYANVGQA